MNTKKSLKLVFRIFSIIIFSILVTTLLASSIFAKYLTGDSNDDGARVAKWDIDFNDGTNFNSIISSTHLESGSKGEWGLDIANKSEVLAKFGDSSSFKIRLHSPNFDINSTHEVWDFLLDNENNPIDNPINFKAVMYNCSLTDLDSSNGDIEAVVIFNTKTHPEDLDFQAIIDGGELYLECVVNAGEKLNATDKFLLAIGEGKACLKIYWEVEEVAGAVDTNEKFKSYYLLKETEYDSTKYDGKLDNAITIDSVKYVIAYKLNDYFEYLIYTSSLGGEIMITFTDSLGKTYVRRCTKLSDAEKANLLNRTLDDPTLENVTGYLELLEYNEFEKFLKIQSDYSKVTGYLGLGLECRIILDIKIEQAD
jgi:hypothetical protein